MGNEESATKVQDRSGVQLPGILTGLAGLPEGAMVTEKALADRFGVVPRTIRRMVARRELPPPIAVGGRSVWFADRVLAWLTAEAERREREAERHLDKVRRLAV